MEISRPHLIIRILLFATITFLQGKTLLAQAWRETSGPSGGEVSKIIIHPQNPQIIYAIVSLPFSGVFKSRDGGNFWTALNNGFEFDSIESDTRWPKELAIDESNPETLYVAITDAPMKPNFLYRSVDGGASWTVVKKDKIFALYADKGKVFALSSSGLLFSSNAGNSWVIQNESLSGGDGSKILADDQKMLWVSNAKGLYKSADSGKTFQQIVFSNTGQIQVFDIATVAGQKLIAASVGTGGYGSFYVSYDEGKTWLDRTATLPFEPTLNKYEIPYDVKISRQNIDHIFAGLSKGFFRTKNGGVNWEQQNSGLLSRTIAPSVFALAVSPQKPGFIIAGTGNDGIFLSTDEGLNWRFVSAPSGKVEALSVSRNSGRIFAASTGGVYYYDGNIWTPTALLMGQIIGSLTEMQVSPHNARFVLCGMQNSILYGDVYRTFDAGLAWDLRPITPGEGIINKIVFDPIDTNRVYVAWSGFDGSGGVMVSDTQGDTWVPLGIPSGRGPVGMAINQIDNRILYLLRDNGQVDRSKDRGMTWTQIRASIDSQHTVIRIDPRNQNTIYLGSFFLFRSEDDGNHWMRMPFDKKVTDLTIDPETGEIFVGTFNEGLWRSSDGAKTFVKMPGLPSERITSLLFSIKNHRRLLFAGTMGVGAYYHDLGPISNVATDEKIVPRSYLAQNYPNPFNAQTQITYELAKPEKVFVQIFNVFGQRIKTLLNEEQPAGSHSITWDGTDETGKSVSSGLYLYTLSFRSTLLVKKMMYLK